jgi:hypothetical protein
LHEAELGRTITRITKESVRPVDVAAFAKKYGSEASASVVEEARDESVIDMASFELGMLAKLRDDGSLSPLTDRFRPPTHACDAS